MGLTHWLVFHPGAWDDLDAAADYYATKAPELSLKFFGEVAQAAALAKQFPGSGRVTFRDVRRIPLQKFPYTLLYRVVDNTVWVMAIVNQRRDPASIRAQLDERL